MSESKFRLRNQTQNLNSDVENEIPISTSKPKSKFRFRHRNVDKINKEFRRKFDFVESKKPTFVETLSTIAGAQFYSAEG
jgi:hypothetical protein